ncbi:MAG: alpha/beta hydrolase, partial [Spirochaetia bacterium]
ADYTGYCWDNEKKALKAVRGGLATAEKANGKLYNSIVVGGFSQGGAVSLLAAMQDDIPVLSCVCLCPGLPDFGPREIGSLEKSGVDIFVVTGENDYALEDQKSFFQELEGLRVKLDVIPKLGHWFPLDWKSRLGQILKEL